MQTQSTQHDCWPKNLLWRGRQRENRVAPRATYAIAYPCDAVHMATGLFKSVSGIDMQHIPYNSSGLTLPDLLGGRVTITAKTPKESIHKI